jgi:hypothetical protein
MTDDAGKLPGESSQPTLCDTWGERLFDDQITLGVALMGHRTGVWGHNPLSGSFGKALDELRTDCNARNQDKQSTFLVEHVSLRASVDAFRDTVIPKIIQGLKKVELRR